MGHALEERGNPVNLTESYSMCRKVEAEVRDEQRGCIVVHYITG